MVARLLGFVGVMVMPVPFVMMETGRTRPMLIVKVGGFHNEQRKQGHQEYPCNHRASSLNG